MSGSVIDNNHLKTFLMCIGIILFGAYIWCTRTTHKRIIAVIPSYNNIQWYKRNIDMLIAQDNHYHYWRAIYIDDCSPDGTGQAVKHYIRERGYAHKIKVIQNKKRCGALANLYNGIHSCNDNDIIVTYDGDDFLKSSDVFYRINKKYSQGDVWLTYGQYEEYPSGKIGICRPLPKHIVDANSYRRHAWVTSHLRTFYAGLFKKIKKEDLLYNNEFYPMTWDLAIMYPMLEMAGEHAQFIPDVLYVYNMDNPINDWKKDLDLVMYLNHEIRNKPRYNRLETLLT